jgi:hypothetical protein
MVNNKLGDDCDDDEQGLAACCFQILQYLFSVRFGFVTLHAWLQEAIFGGFVC